MTSEIGIVKFYQKLAAQPLISFLLPFAMVLLGRALLLGAVGPPQPLIQDEFSYLLAGDTFASFRVTNPPHPLWEHFETIHELMQPTYMSKYPPMQGLILAFGQLVFGMPWIGVVLSMAIFCGLLPWTFRAWLPSGWALTGALLATYKIGIMSYWTESFWGGAAAAIGGALVLGATKRLGHYSTPGMAALFTLGGGILANSRPFEGLVLMTGCIGYLAWKWFFTKERAMNKGASWRRFAATSCLVALPIAMAMGYYNYRITGSAMELPYRAFDKQYAVWTPFMWQQKPSPEPAYRHDFIRREWIEWDGAHKQYERDHWVKIHWWDYTHIIQFYFGPAFFPGGIAFIPLLFLGNKNRLIGGLLLFYILGTSVMSDIIPHYTAPAASLIYLAATRSLRTGWHLASGGLPLGKWLVVLLTAIFLIDTTAFRISYENRFLYYKPHFIEKREAVLSFLDSQPGLQLVFVRHGRLHDINEVWTFNRADIDASRIVWVNDMAPTENQHVLDYYGKQRKVWLLEDNADLTLRIFGDPNARPVIDIKNPPPDLIVPR